MSETKMRPTAQDIEGARRLMWQGFNEGWLTRHPGPAEYRGAADALEAFDRVFDYAAACLSAEVEAETVPTPAPAVEPSASAPAAGTPAWEHQGGVDWRAHSGPMTALMYTMYANDAWWTRYPDSGEGTHIDNGVGPTLAANIRAASASWNAAHPNLPPVIVPEQFREGPQVEPPEEAGDGDGWIAWTGGECPVEPGVFVEVVLRDGRLIIDEGSRLLWAHLVVTPPSPGDIVRYRIVQPDEPAPPQTPAERVAAMTDEEVEEFVTGEGVEVGWSQFYEGGRRRRRYYVAGNLDEAISESGMCWMPDPPASRYGDKTGDTTTPAGRMECTRRLAVHLLREKGGA